MAEFTGERVIPGLVETDLFNEHMARYRFAAQLAGGARVLDAGCGSGYGAAELGAAAASVTGADVAAEAVGYARQHFGGAGVRFVQASCQALPFAGGTFDLVTAFEVIEHLERREDFLAEAARVLTPGGVLLVSTPNKTYYAEARGTAGPNPFHCHEYERAEFEGVLRQVFPHVRLWTQNRTEAIVLAPERPDGGALDAGGDTEPDNAHFFLAVCSAAEIPLNEVFAWVPRSANLLRERERHIAMLQGELAKKDVWLAEAANAHGKLQAIHEETLAELQQRNRWAERLNDEVRERRAAIVRLQQEAASGLEWARRLEAEIGRGDAEIVRLTEEAKALEAELRARTVWARKLEEQLAERTAHVRIQIRQIEDFTGHVERAETELARLREERRRAAASRWVRLGRRLGVGPVLDDPAVGE